MEHITTYSGEDFTPFAPDAEQIKLEDIAHSLSLLCRANGHFTRFYSVAHHCINCCHEAEARGLPVKIQLACLLHDASEAYISDIPRPVKKHLAKFIDVENKLQDIVYAKFLGGCLSEDEYVHVEQIDNDMLAWEFNKLMPKKVFEDTQAIRSNPSAEFVDFADIKTKFMDLAVSLMEIQANEG